MENETLLCILKCPTMTEIVMQSFIKIPSAGNHKMLGPEMGNYVVMTTTETDEATKFPKAPGRINGGFFKKTKDSQGPSVVIAVPDIEAAMKKSSGNWWKDYWRDRKQANLMISPALAYTFLFMIQRVIAWNASAAPTM